MQGAGLTDQTTIPADLLGATQQADGLVMSAPTAHDAGEANESRGKIGVLGQRVAIALLGSRGLALAGLHVGQTGKGRGRAARAGLAGQFGLGAGEIAAIDHDIDRIGLAAGNGRRHALQRGLPAPLVGRVH